MADRRSIGSFLYKLREYFWFYPDTVFLNRESVVNSSWIAYKKLRPFSHILLGIVVYLLITALMLVDINAFLRIDKSTFIEGTVVGVDEEGNLLGLDRITPLIPSTIQLEKDLSELIYESLIKVNQKGEVNNVLIESYEEVKRGNHYRFKLKEDVHWHDGTTLTTRDVEATFNLLRDLDEIADTASNNSSVVANQMDNIIINDEYSFELKLESNNAVLPTFFESINFKILPAAYLQNVDSKNIQTPTPLINTHPIGTGPYKLQSSNEKTITLERNSDYHASLPKLEEIVFVKYANEEDAVNALKSGEIHAIAGITSSSFDILSEEENLRVDLYKSNVIYNQYWAIYFNLDNNLGLEMLQNKTVRRAINHGINKDNILQAISRLGEKAQGPIPEISFAFAQGIDRNQYNPELANNLLRQEGWTLNNDGYYQKNNQVLGFTMVFVNNDDRRKVAEVIQTDLKQIGVKVELESKPYKDLLDGNILNRSFDVLLFGQTTFIDPDRYELFHSSQISFPQQGEEKESSGLNISSYTSQAQTSEIENQELIRVPKVDKLLEEGRSFLEPEKRRENYVEFQRVVLDEVPVIFLYHPIYPYAVNKRVKGIRLDQINNLEERFGTITDWNIEI